MQFNVAQREITLKIVYYGPPLSGKTTNLQEAHKLLDPRACGRLTTLDTADDRTLFFDLLPIFFLTQSGYRVKIKMFTVPGQVIHAATRRIVLAGADGVVFVADSQLAEAKRNNEYWHGMRHYLTETGVDPNVVPTVIQFNKRDLPNVRTEEELAELRLKWPAPIFLAVAVRGHGVLETLYGLLQALLSSLNAQYNFEAKFQLTSRDFMKAIFGNALADLERGAGR